MPKHEKLSRLQNNNSSLSDSHKAKQAQLKNEKFKGTIIQKAALSPQSLTPTDIMQLQKVIGNRAVSKLLTAKSKEQLISGTGIQTKKPDDIHGMTPSSIPQESSAEKPMQFAVSHCALYPPSPAAVGLIGALDAQIPIADANAQADLANPPGGVHTPHQANYIQNPIAASWGYCVEEQLDPLAVGLGWATQVPLDKSRPDYTRTILPNTRLFVDLTSVAQAGIGGNHIMGKLAISTNTTGAIWEASDITHNGPPGGVPPVLHPNGRVTKLQMQRFQVYKRYISHKGSKYSPRKDEFFHRYGHVSHATFTQVWNSNQRRRFSAAAKNAGFRI
jgi:hypothetical protein